MVAHVDGGEGLGFLRLESFLFGLLLQFLEPPQLVLDPAHTTHDDHMTVT